MGAEVYIRAGVCLRFYCVSYCTGWAKAFKTYRVWVIERRKISIEDGGRVSLLSHEAHHVRKRRALFSLLR